MLLKGKYCSLLLEGNKLILASVYLLQVKFPDNEEQEKEFHGRLELDEY